MSKHKFFLLAQSLLCVLLVLLLAAAVIGLYREGAALQAEDPLHWIFTRESLGARLAPLLPLLLLSLALTVLGLVLGIRDERAERPGKDAERLRDAAVSRGTEPGGALQAERAGQKKPFSRTRLLRGVVLALALALILAGVCNGSAADVFGKAVKICTECVGLG